MKLKLRIVFVLMILALPVIIVWLGEQYVELSLKRERDDISKDSHFKCQFINANIENYFNLLSAKIVTDLRKVRGNLSNESMIDMVNPDIEQLTIFSESKRIVYPVLPDALSQRKLSYYLALVEHVNSSTSNSNSDENSFSQSEQKELPGCNGWSSLFWQDGIAIHYCHITTDGQMVFIRTPKLRILSNIIRVISTSLPENVHFNITDYDDKSLYSTSTSEELKSTNKHIIVQESLPSPLTSWKIQLSMPSRDSTFSRQIYTICGLFIIIGWLLSGIAYYWFVRSILVAAQRVSFVNRVSHELKTPLTNIRLYAELLAESELVSDDDTRKKLNIITAETARLSRLVSNILTFSRQQKNKIKLRFVDVNPDTVIRNAVESFLQSFLSSGIEVTLDLNADKALRLDPDALEQILVNLLSNADKYAPGSTVKIESEIINSALVVSFSDTGPGIPYSKRNAIFKPFTRLSSAVNEGASGNGIGLSISRELAVLHGGNLELLETSHGASFRLSLSEGNA